MNLSIDKKFEDKGFIKEESEDKITYKLNQSVIEFDLNENSSGAMIQESVFRIVSADELNEMIKQKEIELGWLNQ